MRDPYLYSDVDVLKNIEGIRNKKRLDEFEGAVTGLALTKLLADGYDCVDAFSVFDLHKILFEDIYEWAGLPREVDISKSEPILGGLSVMYSGYNSINEELTQISNYMTEVNWNILSQEDFIREAIRIFSEIWRIHPFREGNTRTVFIFIVLWFEKYGFKVNADYISRNAKFFRISMVLAAIGSYTEYGEYEHIEKILTGSITGDDQNDLSIIKDYDVNKYEYKDHEYSDQG